MIFNSSSATSYLQLLESEKKIDAVIQSMVKKRREGVEGWKLWAAVSSLCCHHKTNAVALRVLSSRCLGQVWVLCRGAACTHWPLRGAEGAVPPPHPRLTLVSQASRREFLLHCALVVLGNADLRPCGSGSAVVRRSLLAPGWPRRWRGLSWRWAASSFLPGLWLEWMWDSNFLPLSDSSESGHRENKSEETTKFQWSFSRFLGFFLSFHPISWSSSVHSLVNNSGKPQAAKSDPCIFSDAEGI